MKRLFAVQFAVCVGLLLGATELLALDLTKLTPQGYLSDFANVVDAPSKAAIDRYLMAVEKATGAQVALVTLPSIEGEPIEQVANQLYRQWGVGKKETNEGVLFLFAIKERRSRLEVGYGLEPILPDGAAGGLLRAMRPALRAGNYSAAFIDAARQLGERLAGAKGVKIEEELPAGRRMRGSENPLDGIPLTWLVIGVVVLFLLLRGALGRSMGGRGRRGGGPWIMPGGFGGGFGGSSGGGGSSWGGFGGGDSGGGGASSDW